jgi:hypothetical protein
VGEWSNQEEMNDFHKVTGKEKGMDGKEMQAPA